ncbi:MATE family efflux transporter [Pararoseomonas indoligenes]|uniref:MATE family efflux transporter n=1 Tax=Roseomonas indoligenes TaxID=2820811 RepID=A0A940N6N1_9PROT|nr:MATE family efflux transporter [Pararoseomonas indoligenes]MBP0495097.1 MATE family efflux transporter [Pararoseomonas indoligenes]
MAANGTVTDARTRRLLEAPLLPTLLALAAPNAFVMVTQAAIGLLEIYFIARLGVDALAGVSQVFPVLALTIAVSQGAMGGGIVSSIARSLGRGAVAEASEVAWYAVAIALVLGLVTSALVLVFGGPLYQAMGAEAGALDAAQVYSRAIFAGAALIWLFNALLSVVRGTGNLILPMMVVGGGALLLLPLSPLLIFGIGGLPGLGVGGGAAAILLYYAGGSLCFALHIWRYRGVLHPATRPPRLALAPAWNILRVGGLSTLVSASTNVTIAIVNAFVGAHGTAAVAGYGAGARLEFLLVPLSYGIGGPAGILIGTNIGAGQGRRALRTAWTAVLMAALVAEAIGLAAAFWPEVWLGGFSGEPEVLATGTAYLRTTGPFYGFFGAAFAAYCAAQGAGRMGWPVAGAFTRSAIAILGGWMTAGLHGLFLAVGLGMAAFGLIAMVGLITKAGYVAASKRAAPPE